MEGGRQNGSAERARPKSRLTRLASVTSAAAALALAWLSLRSAPYTWTFEYYRNRALGGSSVTGQLRNADFKSEALLPAGLVDTDNFSLRLRTCLRLPSAGRFVFRLTAHSGARLYLDGQLLLDAWKQSATTVQGKDIEIAKGNHPLLVEYFDAAGTGSLSVEMSQPGVYEFRNLQGRTQLQSKGGECESI
jgi:PA14 domain-containing protein